MSLPFHVKMFFFTIKKRKNRLATDPDVFDYCSTFHAEFEDIE